jgi:hypothetical protein
VLLLVLILVLGAFGLLVVALLSGSVLWAWVSVGVSVAAAAVLVIDWLQRRSAVRAGGRSASAGVVDASARTRGPADFDPVTEVIPIVPPQGVGAAGSTGNGVAAGYSGRGSTPYADPRFDLMGDGQQTVVMPIVQPSGSADRPSGAPPEVSPSGGIPLPTVTNGDPATPGAEPGAEDVTGVHEAGSVATARDGDEQAGEPSTGTGSETDPPEDHDREPVAVGGPLADAEPDPEPGADDRADDRADDPGADAAGPTATDPDTDADAHPDEQATVAVALPGATTEPAAEPAHAGEPTAATAAEVSTPDSGFTPDAEEHDQPGVDTEPTAAAEAPGPAGATRDPDATAVVDLPGPPAEHHEPEPGPAHGDAPEAQPAAGVETRGAPADPEQPEAVGATAAQQAPTGPAQNGSPDAEATTVVDTRTFAAAEQQPDAGPPQGGGPDAETTVVVDTRGATAAVRHPDAAESAQPAQPAQPTLPPAGPDGEPPEEPSDPRVAALVAGLEDEVVVVDERPRYHVTGCPSLVAKQVIPLPVREAVELEFTPCGWCTPDRTLSARHRTPAR